MRKARSTSSLAKEEWHAAPSEVAAPRDVDGRASARAMEAASTAPALSVHDIQVRFKGIVALNGVSMSLDCGEVLGVVGPNGAGKTTLINAIAGEVRPKAGEVRLGARRITPWARERRARHGIMRTFQQLELFEGLTVAEHLEVALATHRRAAAGGGRTSHFSRRDELVQSFDLGGVLHKQVSLIAQGERVRVSLARAFACRPRFMLLDEPGAGLTEIESARLSALIRDAVQEGIGVMLVDHNLRLVMEASDRVALLSEGKVLAIGSPDEVQANREFREAYTGVSGQARDGRH